MKHFVVFWTQRRFAGMALLLGVLLFASGTVISTFLVDARGTSIFLLPPQQGLLVIAGHPLLWHWMTILHLSGTLVTAVGVVLLTAVLGDAGSRTGSQVGLIAFLFSTALWVLILAFRLSVSLWVAQATTKAAPAGFYVPLYQWTEVQLFTISIILAFCALAAYGVEFLATAALPRWAGWITLLYAIAGVLLVVFAGATLVPPELVYLAFAFVGILLLLRRDPTSPGGRPRKTALGSPTDQTALSR
jgi:hypothetical protein